MEFKVLISGSYNAFNEGWNGCGVYMASGNYVSETFRQPIYLGSSYDLQDRIEDQHISQLNRNKHSHNKPLQYSWNKHSEKEGFIWFLIELCESEKCKETEQKYLDLYRPFVDEFGGFNIHHSAVGFHKGHIPWNKGKILSENEISILKERGFKKGHIPWNTGLPHSAEVKIKMSKARIGKVPWNKGLSPSEETRKKISLANRKPNLKKRKNIICIETGVIYNGILEAGKILGIQGKNIHAVCKGKRKTCGGFHWKYVDELNQN